MVVAYELLHSMQNKLKGKQSGYMALKLEICKTYDQVEWGFLHAVMLKMGFDSTWVELVMQRVTIVSYAILINGIPQESFQPTQGIRQGDSLSPYLFIICSKILSFYIKSS